MYRLIASAYTRITAHGVAADDNSDVRQILYLVQTLYCANSDPIDTHTRMNNICIFFSLAENGSAINHVEFIFSPFDHPTIFVWTSPTEKIKINAKKNKKKKYSAHHYEINHRARPVEIICKSINRFCICVFSGGHHFSPNVWHQFIDGATRLWIAFKMHLQIFRSRSANIHSPHMHTSPLRSKFTFSIDHGIDSMHMQSSTKKNPNSDKWRRGTCLCAVDYFSIIGRKNTFHHRPEAHCVEFALYIEESNNNRGRKKTRTHTRNSAVVWITDFQCAGNLLMIKNI